MWDKIAAYLIMKLSKYLSPLFVGDIRRNEIERE